MDERLRQVRMNPWSPETPRFYPPGQHPAMHKERLMLKKFEEYRVKIVHNFGDTTEIDKAIAYSKEKLANFEAAESEYKARAAQEMGLLKT